MRAQDNRSRKYAERVIGAAMFAFGTQPSWSGYDNPHWKTDNYGSDRLSADQERGLFMPEMLGAKGAPDG